MAVVWALSWLLLGVAGLVPASALATVGMLAFMGVFAFGETLMQPTVPAIANDLASDRTRGRYNAISAGAFQGGAIAGPVAAGFLLEHDLAGPYIVLMLIGSPPSERWLSRSSGGSPPQPTASPRRPELPAPAPVGKPLVEG